MSDIAKDLIKSLLIVDPSARLTADQILAHPWITGENTPRTELPNVTEKIREFNAKRRFKVSFFLSSPHFQIESDVYDYGGEQVLEHPQIEMRVAASLVMILYTLY